MVGMNKTSERRMAARQSYPSNRVPTMEEVSLAPQPIRDPGLIAKADECLKFVAELENTVQRIDGFLFEYKPQPVEEVCNSASSVDDTLAGISTRLACLVGHTRTILSRIED